MSKKSKRKPTTAPMPVAQKTAGASQPAAYVRPVLGRASVGTERATLGFARIGGSP